MTLDLDYLKQIAERRNRRIEAERAEALKRKNEVRPETQEPEEQTAQMPEEAEPRGDYVYVPSLGLYISEQRNLQGKDWNQTQKILHKEGRRMPTIPEFVEFLKYLRSAQGKKNVKNADKILDEIYKVEGDWRSEWLDAKFDGNKVTYHVFDSKGKIVQREEKLEAYLAEDKTPGIDLESWLANPTKQGLPKPNCKAGNLYYWSPENGRVAWFCADSGRAYLGCDGGPAGADAALGVRYVEPLASGENAPRKFGSLTAGFTKLPAEK